MHGGSLSLAALDLYGNETSGFYYDDLSVFAASDGDCDANHVPDVCDIADDPSLDCNETQILDECESADIGDFDANGVVDLADFSALLDCLAGPETAPKPPLTDCVNACFTAFDIEPDGDVDIWDFAYLQRAFSGP